MEWQTVTDRQESALLRIVATLFAMAGLAESARVSMLPRRVYNAILCILQPAESAMRRLIIIAARGIELKFRPGGAIPAGLFKQLAASAETRLPVFCLIDPLKKFAFADSGGTFEGAARSMPRISVPGIIDPVFAPAPPVLSADDPIAAHGICQRLQILKHALETLPKQARRLARWQARQRLQMNTQAAPGRRSPLRPGFPPGLRRRHAREIDEILSDCHYFAVESWAQQNTS